MESKKAQCYHSYNIVIGCLMSCYPNSDPLKHRGSEAMAQKEERSGSHEIKDSTIRKSREVKMLATVWP